MEPSKSILRRRNSAIAPSSAGRGATPTSVSAPARTTRDKRRVEITSPPQSVVSNEDATVPRPKLFKQTPLPRVALLSASKKSVTRKESSKIAIKLKGIRLRAKRSPSIPSHKINTRRGRRGSKSNDDRPTTKEKETTNVQTTTATHEYVKEIGTINHIIKAVVNPVTAVQKGQPLLEGIVRPLSADELGQLLKSIGNVATIHENIDGTSSPKTSSSSKSLDEDHAIPEKRETRKTKTRKSKNRRRVSSLSSHKVVKLSNYLPLIKQGGGTSPPKGQPYVSNTSSGKLSKAQMLINSKATKSSPTTIKPQTPKSPVKKLRSMKSQVKALIKEQLASKKSTRKGRKKGKGSDSQEGHANKASSETAISVMSDLDLIKSAILNKRYYDESMALAQSSSKDKLGEDSPTRRKRSQSVSGKKRKSSSTGKKPVSHAAVGGSISPADSDLSLSTSRRESLQDLRKKSEKKPDPSSLNPSFLQSTFKMLKDQKRGVPHSANVAATANSKKDTLQLIKTEADNKQHLKDVLVNYSHVIRGPEPAAVPKYNYKKDFQFAEDGELYFTQRILTAPRFNAMNAELHDDTKNFDQHVEKTKSIQKRFTLGSKGEGPVTEAPPKITLPLKEKKKSRPGSTGTPSSDHDSKSSKSNTPGERKKRGEKSLEEGFSTPHQKSQADPINELYSYRNTLHKDYKESIITNLPTAQSAWAQQSLYPSAYPSVVNTLGTSGGIFDREERWSTLNQKTMKKNEEIKDKTVDSGEMEDIRRRIHPPTPKRYEGVDDENKILDSYATYIKIKGNSQPTGNKDPNMTQLLMKNKV